MKTFSGFRAGKVRNVRMPEPVFTHLIPLIDDLDELKVTLHVLYQLSQQRGRLRYLRHRDLLDDRLLVEGMSEPSRATVEEALERAIERGTLLRTELDADVVYLANTPRGRAGVEALRRGEQPPEAESTPRSNIFVLYEENIGPLTPLIVDELKEAEELYPGDWIEEAFREAVALNKRSWRYIHAILERWRSEGRKDEATRGGREGDRRRYVEGEYSEYIEH